MKDEIERAVDGILSEQHDVEKAIDMIQGGLFGLGAGRMSNVLRRRLRALMVNPSQETWDDAHSIIVGPHTTLWQAILVVDPTFPKTGAATDQVGNVVRPWPRVPAPDLVIRAIQFAQS